MITRPPPETLRAPERRGSVVLISEVLGVDEALRGYAAKMVAQGYDVVMPDLWWRTGPPDFSGEGAVQRAVERIVDAEAMSDVRAALETLEAPRFLMGFCLGGLYARMGACTLPRLAGTVEFYGRVVYPGTTPAKPVQPLDFLPGLGCPLQCHFGDLDTVAPPRHVDLLEERLAGRRFAAQVFRYAGCGHAFMNPSRAAYRPVPAELAWSRGVKFLGELSAPSGL